MSFKVDFSKFKKVGSDKTHTTMEHENGHQLRIAHGALSHQSRKELASLPMMAMGGGVEDPTSEHLLPGDQIPNKIEKDYVKRFADGGTTAPEPKHSGSPAVDPKKAKEIQDSANESGWQPERWKKNLGLAKGGTVGPNNPKLAESKKTLHEPCSYCGGGQMLAEGTKDLEVDPISPPPLKLEPVSADDPDAQPTSDQPQGTMPPPAQTPLQQQSLQQPLQAAQQPQQGQIPASPQSSSPDMAAKQAAPQAPAEEEPTSMGGYQKEKAGILAEGDAVAARGKQEAIAVTQAAKATNDLMTKYQEHFDQLNSERQNFQQDIQDKHIDPNHYMGSMDTLGKFSTAIGLALGGLGAGLTGGGNQALDFLNRQIDRDIDAQKAELGKKESLLSANMRQFGNQKDATDMTRIMLNDIAIDKFKKADAMATSPLAKANAQKQLGALEMQVAPIAQKLATRRMLASTNTSEHPLPPATQARMMKESGILDEEQYKEVNKEIARAEDTKKVAASALANYDAIVKQHQSMLGAGRLGAKLYTPAEQDAMVAEIASTVSEKEGTVRQAAMDAAKAGYLPKTTDTPERAKTRRAEFVNYLNLKSSAPIAESYGIKLPKAGDITLTPRLQSFLDWAKANPNNPKSAYILKKLGQ